jgi:pyruvate-formate lyase-activating enzyme
LIAAGDTSARTPERVAIHVGFACNNRCVFCAQGELRSREPFPDDGALDVELRQAAARGVDIALMGGEPTLRTDLPALVTRARSLGIGSVLLQTNGRRFAYKRYAQALVAAGVDALEVSWHGARAEIHDYHTGVPGSWQQTTAGIRAAVASGLPVSVTALLTRSSFRHVVELVEAAAALGVGAVHLAFPAVIGTAASLLPRVVPRFALQRPKLDAAAEMAERRGLPMFVSGVPPCVWAATGDGVAALAGQMRRSAGACHAAVCEYCARAATCGGVDPAYVARYGMGELEPHRCVGDTAVGVASTRGFAGLGRLAAANVG